MNRSPQLPPRVRLVDELGQCIVAAEERIHRQVVVCVVAMVRRGHEDRVQVERRDAEVLQVVEPLGEAAKIADAITIAVVESADVHLVDDRVFVPKAVWRSWQARLP